MIIPYDKATEDAGRKLAAGIAHHVALAVAHGPEALAGMRGHEWSRATPEEIAAFWRRQAGLAPAQQAA